MKIRIIPPNKLANRPATIDLEPEHIVERHIIGKLNREHPGYFSVIGRDLKTSAIKHLRLQIVEQTQG